MFYAAFKIAYYLCLHKQLYPFQLQNYYFSLVWSIDDKVDINIYFGGASCITSAISLDL